MTRRLKSWSYSRWESYTECPLHFKLRHLDKIPEVSGPALERGSRIHDEADVWLKGPPAVVPPDLAAFGHELAVLRTLNAVGEETWILDRDWQPVPLTVLPDGKWLVDWSRVWLILKLDAHAMRPDRVLEVVDYKTGKVRDKSLRQTELYAVGGFALYDADVARTRLWFTDHGETLDAEYTVGEADALASDWERRVAPMFNDTRFAPNPGYFCKWCPHAKSKGGVCPVS